MFLFIPIAQPRPGFRSFSYFQSFSHFFPLTDIITKAEIDLRVVHIAGKLNIAADLLSCLLYEEFRRLFPSYGVRTFEPPRHLLLAMEELLLNHGDGPSSLSSFRAGRRPVMPLKQLDDRVSFLHSRSLETSTKSEYETGARDYTSLCFTANYKSIGQPEKLPSAEII